MYSILIGLAICIVGLILFYLWWDNTPRFRYDLVVVLLVLEGVGSIVLPCALGDSPPTITGQTEVRTGIVAIKDNTITEGSVRGAIFVMSGYISEEPVYFFYKRVGTGYTQDSIKAKGVTIYEDTEPGVGYISTTTTVEKVDPVWKKKHLHWLVFNNVQSRDTVTEIHVPQGTIIQEFVLDAE